MGEESAKGLGSPVYAKKCPLAPYSSGMHVKNTFINLASDDSPWMVRSHSIEGCLSLMAMEADGSSQCTDADQNNNQFAPSMYTKHLPNESLACNLHVKNTFIDLASDDNPWKGLRSVHTTAGCLNLMSMED